MVGFVGGKERRFFTGMNMEMSTNASGPAGMRIRAASELTDLPARPPPHERGIYFKMRSGMMIILARA